MSKAPVGVLLLHGLSSHVDCIDPVVPRLEKYGLPYRLPVLRGHGGQPSDLNGVVWQNWLEDGQKAFDDLLTEVDQVIVVALSMGGLVGINLVENNQAQVAGLVCIAAALKMKSKLTPLAPVVARFQKNYQPKFDPKSYFDLEQAKTSRNYKQMPASAVLELLSFIRHTRQDEQLAKITVPTLILQTTQDRTVDPKIAQYLYDTISSKDKRLVWFHRSGHEMLRDAQREEVLDQIENFVVEITQLSAVSK